MGTTGFAWRFEMPEDLLFWASNNLLEYIASMISPWVDMLAGRLKRGDCILSMTDSSTSAAWLRTTNFWELVPWGERRPGPIKSLHRHRTSSHHPLPQGRHQGALSVVPSAGKQCRGRSLAWLWLLRWWTNKNYPQILPLSASTAFSNSTTAQQNQLMADLIAAETSHEGAVTGSTHKNHAWLWHQFTKYLGTIGIGHDIFLNSFTRS